MRASSRSCRAATGHVLRSEPARRAPDILSLEREQIGDRYEVLRHGGGGPPTALVCGAVRLEHPAARDLVRALPATIVVGAGAPGEEWIQSSLRLLAAEARQPRPGGEAVITRLADIIVIQALRAWIGERPGRAHRLARRAARPAHRQGDRRSCTRDPARDWTVASLAAELAMSRSAFAARFTELVGEPAMQYVTRWRMHVALAALQDGGVTVAQLADRRGWTTRGSPRPTTPTTGSSGWRRWCRWSA